MSKWESVKSEFIVTYKTGKLDSNAAIENGKYPFFTCAETTYKINTYAFDTECVLLAGNNAAGIFPLKYYKGKFNAYQRTYVIEPKDNEKLYIKYFYYLLRPFLRNFEQAATGATTKFLTLKILNNLEFMLPPLPVQRKIAAVLSAYDDLIENNTRRIALLEKMAEEIYREWFVRLRFPGHEQVTFHKGIPEDWDIQRLEDFCERVTDGTHDTPKPTEEGYYLITGKNLKNGKIDFTGAYKISRKDHLEISKRSGLNPGDIIFSNIGTLGSMAVVSNDIEYSVKNVLIFKPYDSNQSAFLYYMLKERYVLEQLLAHSSGASQQFIGLTVARNFKILNPGKALIRQFGELILPLRHQKNLLERANYNLGQTRDRLLTRLISGKLSVEDLDIQFPPSMKDDAPAPQG